MGGPEGGRPQGTPWSRGALGLTALLLLLLIAAPAPRAGAQGGGSGVQIFGPKEYVRTTGAPNQYTDTFAVPSWVSSPFTLHVQNGDPSGSNRVSSATITVNGTQVAGPSDFNQNVAGFDRTVTLTAQTTLHVSLASKPGSFLILNLGGASGDHTAPVVAVAMPADGHAVNTATPSFDVTYGDAGSGVDTSTLAVTLDGADRTSLFTKRPGDASATLPASLALAPGAHTLTATVKDNAGNAGTATSHFTVDLAPPQIQITAPAAGSYLATATPAIHVTYGDDAGLDLSTLKVLVNSVDRTALFAKTATDATATLTSSTALPQGANQITAQIADAAGNLATDAAAFNVDLTAPVLTIASPASGARFGDSSVPVSITYHDDQAIDPGSLQVKVDGHPIALTAGSDGAGGTATGVADGSHTLTAHVADRAGNAANATVSFVVDTAAPTIQVTAPAAGAFVGTGSPAIAIAYSDPDAVSTGSFKVLLNGVDRTGLFTVGPTGATAALAGRLTLADGAVTVNAQIANLAGIVGSTSSAFTVDTAPPTVAVTAPTGSVASAAPAATVTYSDAGSGIDTASVHILLDGADVTSLFALTSTKAVGTLAVDPPLADGAHTLAVTVADRAGNPKTASSSFTVDTAPPTATFAAPADNAFLNNPSPALELDYSDGPGSGVDPTKIHVFLSHGSDPETEITSDWSFGAAEGTGQIPAASPLADATYHLRAALEDRAGNAATARATFEIDTVRPTYQIVQPALSSVLSNHTPAIVVAYQDDASGVDTARLELRIDGVDESALLVAGPDQATATLGAADALADGTHSVEVTVVDRAGNQAPVVAQSFTVDTGAPTIQASAAPPPNAAGWNNAPVTVTFACGDAGSSVATCPPPVTVSTEGAGQVVSGTAVDAAGNSATASVTLSIDLTPPTIAQLTTPAQLVPGATAPVSLTATDNVAVASVVFQVNGTTAATLTAPPFQLDLAVPPGANAGDTLTVTAVVADLAGNTATASRGVAVVGRGVVVGQVLADATGLPLPGASVQVVGGTGQDVADDDGRYSIPVSSSHLFLQISRPADPGAQTPAMLPVEREVSVQSGVGTVPVDARLTAVASPVSIDAGGGALSAGAIHVAVPAGAVSGATAFHLTPLSGQGLPNLLPLGWSPVTAFDLRADAATSGALDASFGGLPQGQPLQLVVYDAGVHAWTMVAPGLTSADGTLAAPLPAPGAYALVVADADLPLVVPDPGQPLPGADMVLLPPDAASSGALAPPSLSPAGGTATATLAVSSSVPLPSGTVIQANVTESYTLTSGDQLSSPSRAEDLVLYRYAAGSGVPAGAALAAAFPVTPSESFEVADLQSGKVHLDILAGRESVRGEAGGSGAVVVQDGDASLAVAAGSLPEDTAIDLTAEPLAAFLPTGNGLTPLAQYEIDLGGEVLALPAQLSDAAGAAQPGDALLLARIQRFGGVPRLVPVALAQVSGGRIVTQPYPGLPGITVGGEYVFYRSAQPLGFVAGRVSATGGGGGGVAAGALVSTDALPFVTLSDAVGQYTLPALPGAASVKATVPQTALVATGSVAVTAGQTAALDLALSGAVTAATVDPADGAVGVDPTAGITVVSADPLNPATATAANVQLFQVTGAGNQPIAVRFVLAQGNRQLSIFPLAALQPSSRYTLQVTGLATAVGGLVAVPSVTFTTRGVTPPNFNPDALVFAFPDANGNVGVSAPANSFPAGSQVLIVDQTNGVVLSLTVGNDGAVSGQLPATIDDVLLVTVTAPDKSTASFTRSQFVAPDGSVAVGPGGGTVTGPGGTALIVPAGAVSHGVTFKLDTFGPDAFQDRPDVDDLNFGSGLTVKVDGAQQFAKEIKLVFPKPPDAPDGSQYYVYRRVALADGTLAYEVIDHAEVQGSGSSAQVVTASPPFPGYQTVSVINGIDTFLVTWIFDPLFPNFFTQGAITGRVLSPSLQPGKTDPVISGVPGAHVYTHKPLVTDADTRKLVFATSQSDGTYVLWDKSFTGGTVTVFADTIPASFLPSGSTQSVFQATAFEIQNRSLLTAILGRYRNVATADITLPQVTPPVPGAQFTITVVQESNGTRTATAGIATVGSSLVIGVTAAPGSPQAVGVVGTTISIDGKSLAVGSDPLGQYPVIARYSADSAGVFTVQVAVANAFGGPPATATNTFRVIGGGGSITAPTPGVPPKVLTALSNPTNGATQVPVTINPVIVFSEPVLVPAGSVTLRDSGGASVPIVVSGVDSGGVPHADVSQAGPTTAYSSLTLLPRQTLRFSGSPGDPNGMYQIVLSSAIKDQAGLPLDPGSSPIGFSTFQLQTLSTGAADLFASPGIFVARKRAYVAKVASTLTSATVWMYDVSNPSAPHSLVQADGGFIQGRADDLTGEDNSTLVGGQTLVAVSQAPYPIAPDVFQNSNVYLYSGNPGSATTPASLTWVGAVSVTQGATDGIVLSIAVKGHRLYAATLRKGIQVVDLDQVLAEFPGTLTSRIYFLLNTEGQGFANDAVIATIPVVGKADEEYRSQLWGIKVADYALAGGATQTLAVATGLIPAPSDGSLGPASFVVADPNSQTRLARVLLQAAGGTLTNGRALALGQLQSSALNVAAVVGLGASSSLLAVVDMTDPTHPRTLSVTPLADTATDVILNGDVAVVGYSSDRSELFDLSTPAAPRSLGTIQGVGGRFAIADGSLLFSTGAVPGDPGSALGGVHAALLNAKSILAVKDVSLTGGFDVYQDVPGAVNKITNPIWKASNAAADNQPAAYVQGQTMKATVTFNVDPLPDVPLQNVTITGEVAGLGKLTATGVTIPASPSFQVSFTMDHPLPANQTKFYNPMAIGWSYTTSAGVRYPIGSTAHQVYVTLTTPFHLQVSPPIPVYRTTLHLAVSNDGATDAASAFQKSWSQFAGPKNIRGWDGRLLYYYRDNNGFEACATSELTLLNAATGSGQCGSFARLLLSVLAINGIAGDFVDIEPKDHTEFLVKDWTFGAPSFSAAPDYRWKLALNPDAVAQGDVMVPKQPNGVYGDLTSLSTLKGQNTAPPSEKIFARHFIVKVTIPNVTPSYYDPSYGATYMDQDDFENVAVDGYAQSFPGDAPNVLRVKKSAGLKNIQFSE